MRHWESSSGKTDFIPLSQGLSLNLELTVLGQAEGYEAALILLSPSPMVLRLQVFTWPQLQIMGMISEEGTTKVNLWHTHTHTQTPLFCKILIRINI